MIPEQGKQDRPATFNIEQHEPEMTQEEKDTQEWRKNENAASS